MTLYDRPFYIPVILDVSSLKETELEAFLESVAAHRPEELKYPSDHALDVAKQLASKGYPSLARPMPLDISSPEAIQLFARSLKLFNESCYVRKEPSATAVQRKVTTTADFARIVDDLTLQQDSITLSNIFKTGALKSKVFWTVRSMPLNSRIARTVVPVARVTSKKAAEERLITVLASIDQAILHSDDEERVTFKKNNNPSFQYR